MLDPLGLVATARMLLGEKNKGAPNQVRLRRAVSTAYYALFHGIARAAADALVGVQHRASARYETVYRGFEHSQMKRCCAEVDKPTLIAWSGDDTFFELGDGEKLAALIPHARLEVIDDARTFSMVDQPDRLADLLSAIAVRA